MHYVNMPVEENEKGEKSANNDKAPDERPPPIKKRLFGDRRHN
jgi:hypothetical protein